MQSAFIIITAILLLAIFAVAQTKSSKAGEQELISNMNRYVEAFGNNDTNTLNKILTEDFVFTSSRGVVVTKTEELADMHSGTMKTESATISDLRVRLRGTAAVVTGQAVLKGSWHNQDFSGQYRITATWVKEAGQWRLLAEHASRIAQK